MRARLTQVPIAVSDHDRALDYYTRKAGFAKRADFKGPTGVRWVTVAPEGSDVGFALILAKQQTRVAGDQDPKAGTAGLQIALSTTDCHADYEAMTARGVRFDIPGYERPQRAPWGTSAYFRDPDGNAWALVQQSWVGRMMVRAWGPRKKDVVPDKTTHVPILVRDQDEALGFYVGRLGFEKRQDYGLKGRPRWLTVAPPGAPVEFVLLKGEYVIDPRVEEGYQFTLTTSDCRAEVAGLKARGVTFREPAPVETPFGLLASFHDPDGNRFVLLQPAKDGK